MDFPGGQTAHCLFQLPIDSDMLPGDVLTSKTLTKLISMPKEKGVVDEHAVLLRACRLFIWDEISMIKRTCVEAVDALLRDLRDKPAHFGGSVFILSGDLRQLPPITPGCHGTDVIDACLPRSTLFPGIRMVTHITDCHAHTLPPACGQWGPSLLGYRRL